MNNKKASSLRKINGINKVKGGACDKNCFIF